MSAPVSQKFPSPRRLPLWLRVLLLALLFSFASFAFYLNFGEVIEELYPDRAIETDTEALPLSE